jgi:photosystem II stability/assembly factor-like uncharacterized protein
MKLTRTAFALLLCLHVPRSFASQWIQTGTGLTGSVPAMSALVMDRATGSTFYALSSANLIFKSTDRGATWSALGNLAGVACLELDPTSASTVYAGTTGGIFKTTDGGDTWTSAGLVGASIGRLIVDPVTPSTLYAGADGRVFKSTDRGASWTDLAIPYPAGNHFPFIASLVLDPVTPSTLYVALGAGSNGSFLKSVDAGNTWTVLVAAAGPFYSSSTNLVIDPSTPSTLYRINPLRKSADGGATWTALANPTASGSTAIALAVDPRAPSTLYLSTLAGGHTIFKSTDAGQSWTAVDTIIPAATSFSFSPDSTTIYAATGAGIFKSTDAGLNWGEAKTGLLAFDIQLLVPDPVNSATIYAGGNNGLFRSQNSGESWTEFPAPSLASSLLIDSTNPNVLYLGTRGCMSANVDLFIRTDAGAGWSAILPYSKIGPCDDATGVMALDPVVPNKLYVPFGDDWVGFTVLTTIDNGVHWKNLGAAGLGAANVINAFVIDPNTATNLYAATDAGVFRSTDGGATFLPAGFANMGAGRLAIDPARSNILYAAISTDPYQSRFLGLYKTTDSGATWSPINQGLDDIVAAHPAVTALILDPDRPNVLYLGTSGYGVFKSSDAGASWASFNDGLTFVDVRALAIARGTLPAMYAGTPGGVFKILDRGDAPAERPRR